MRVLSRVLVFLGHVLAFLVFRNVPTCSGASVIHFSVFLVILRGIFSVALLFLLRLYFRNGCSVRN